MLKITSEATANILQKLLNKFLETNAFPDSLKLADITPAVFKKKDPLDKANYRPVSFTYCQNYLKRLCRNR